MQIFIPYHHSSNNAALIAIVAYPIKQLTFAWVSPTVRSHRPFTPQVIGKENTHIMVCRHFEKDPFAEQSTGTKL